MWDRSLELVNYTNWAPHEPNDGGNGEDAEAEDCAVIGYGPDFSQRVWNDAPCNDLYAYALCESLPTGLSVPSILAPLYTVLVYSLELLLSS